MAITKSAKKEIKASKRKGVFNIRTKRKMKASVKNLLKLKTDGEDTKDAYIVAQTAIDKAVKRGIIKSNTGSRKKSRLFKFVKKSA